MNKRFNISDDKLDQILDDVSAAVESLAKSDSGAKPIADRPANGGKISKEEKPPKPEPEQDPNPAPEAGAPSDGDAAAGGPPPEAGAGAPPPADPGAAAGEAPAGEPGGEPGAQDGEISDEELTQIYQSMAPEERERHYMILRQQMMQDHGMQDGAGAPPQAEPPAPPMAAAGGQPPAMKSEPSAGAPLTKREQEQKTELDKTKTELENVKGQVGNLVKALEHAFTPKRRSIEGIEFVAKSEGAPAPKDDGQPTLSKAEKKAKLATLVKSPKLTSDDRSAINAFFLRGEEEDKIDKIIGGNK